MDKMWQPYILHPLRLMMRVETETEKIVAVLHDVVEDSQPPQRWGFDELRREGFSEPVLTALEGVTRRGGETCEDVSAVRWFTQLKAAGEVSKTTAVACHSSSKLRHSVETSHPRSRFTPCG